MNKIYIGCVSVLCILSFQSIAQSVNERIRDDGGDKFPLVIEYSVLDLPFNRYGAKINEGKIATENEQSSGKFSNAISVSSPEQAVQLTNDIMMAGHWGIAKINIFKKKPKLNYLTHILLTGGFDFLMFSGPYGAGWVHEEGHRAIMAASYTYSYNPFSLKKREDASSNGLHSVSYVLDTNLALMKAKNNANFVRLSTMGAEMTYYSITKMQQTSFFNAPSNAKGYLRPFDAFYYLLNLLNTSIYINTCSNRDEMTKSTLEQMANEGGNQKLRDFTGLDFAAWAYDLNHPNEPYSARGINPYGNGYDRYIYGNKLTDDQYKWIEKQSMLSYINVISPFNIGFPKIPLGDNKSFNFSGRYYPTSFGSQIGLELYYKTSRYNLFVAPHINRNKSHTFFGVEAMAYEQSFSLSGLKFLGTVRTILDMQPKNQEFQTSGTSFTGLIGGRLSLRASRNFYPYVTIEGKTKGWIAGNPFLDDNVSVKLGLSARFYK